MHVLPSNVNLRIISAPYNLRLTLSRIKYQRIFFALGLSKTMLWSDDPISEIVTGGVCEHVHFLLPNYRPIVTPDTI